MTGIEDLFRRFDYRLQRDLADDNVNLDLWQQRHIQGNAPVELVGIAPLHAAAHALGHRHASNADLVHGGLQGLEFALLGDDGNQGHLQAVLVGGRLLLGNMGDRNRLIHGNWLGKGDKLVVGVGNGGLGGIQRTCDRKVLFADQGAVFLGVQSLDLLLLVNPQANRVVDPLKHQVGDEHNPHAHGSNAQQLNPQQADSLSVKESLGGGEQSGH